MHVLHCTNELQHKVPYMFGFQWPPAESDSFVQVSLGAIFEDQVGVCAGFEVMEEVHKVVVILERSVAGKLFNPFVHGKDGWSRGSNVRFDQALDGDLLVRRQVLGQEYHTEGAMVQGSNATETPIQHLVLDKDISHALHDAEFGRAAVETGKQVGL